MWPDRLHLASITATMNTHLSQACGLYMKLHLALPALLIALLVGGCAGFTPLKTGDSSADVRSHWGSPTLTQKTAAGERWIYSTAPEGREVWLLDFDSNGHLVNQVQGLTLQRLAQIQNGQKQAEVEALIGPSYYTIRYPFRQEELVHIYRFHDAQIPTCFYVGYDSAGIVTSTGMREEDRKSHLTGLTRPC